VLDRLGGGVVITESDKNFTSFLYSYLIRVNLILFLIDTCIFPIIYCILSNFTVALVVAQE
jgi:hypothetical protein